MMWQLQASWDLLPDNLLLDVFKHLHTADLMTAAKSVFSSCLFFMFVTCRPTLVFGYMIGLVERKKKVEKGMRKCNWVFTYLEYLDL